MDNYDFLKETIWLVFELAFFMKCRIESSILIRIITKGILSLKFFFIFALLFILHGTYENKIQCINGFYWFVVLPELPSFHLKRIDSKFKYLLDHNNSIRVLKHSVVNFNKRMSLFYERWKYFFSYRICTKRHDKDI